jgi:hypothetical protein
MRSQFSKSRRSFFKKLALLGGSAAIGGLSRSRVALRENSAKATADTGNGYRLTPHIRTYYRTADR